MVVWLPRPIDATVHPEPGNRPEAWDSAAKRMRTTEALAAPDAASFAADADVAAALSLGPPSTQEGGAAPAIAGQLSGVDASAISVDLSSSGASSVILAYTISASSAESAQAIILKFRVCLH